MKSNVAIDTSWYLSVTGVFGFAHSSYSRGAITSETKFVGVPDEKSYLQPSRASVIARARETERGPCRPFLKQLWLHVRHVRKLAFARAQVFNIRTLQTISIFGLLVSLGARQALSHNSNINGVIAGGVALCMQS